MVTTDANLIEHGVADRQALVRRPSSLPVPRARGRADRRDRPAELPLRRRGVPPRARRALRELRRADLGRRGLRAVDPLPPQRVTRRVRQRAARLVPAQRRQPELRAPGSGPSTSTCSRSTSPRCGSRAPGRASDATTSARSSRPGDRSGRVVLPACGRGEDASSLRRVKLAAGGLLHLARAARRPTRHGHRNAAAQVRRPGRPVGDRPPSLVLLVGAPLGHDLAADHARAATRRWPARRRPTCSAGTSSR